MGVILQAILLLKLGISYSVDVIIIEKNFIADFKAFWLKAFSINDEFVFQEERLCFGVDSLVVLPFHVNSQ